jgi:hypothetical protein
VEDLSEDGDAALRLVGRREQEEQAGIEELGDEDAVLDGRRLRRFRVVAEVIDQAHEEELEHCVH